MDSAQSVSNNEDGRAQSTLDKDRLHLPARAISSAQNSKSPSALISKTTATYQSPYSQIVSGVSHNAHGISPTTQPRATSQESSEPVACSGRLFRSQITEHSTSKEYVSPYTSQDITPSSHFPPNSLDHIGVARVPDNTTPTSDSMPSTKAATQQKGMKRSRVTSTSASHGPKDLQVLHDAIPELRPDRQEDMLQQELPYSMTNQEAHHASIAESILPMSSTQDEEQQSQRSSSQGIPGTAQPDVSNKKMKRRTAAEVQELHVQRDKAGLPRLKQYPRDLVTTTAQIQPPDSQGDISATHTSSTNTPDFHGRHETNTTELPDLQLKPGKTPGKRGRPRKSVTDGPPKTAAKRGRPRKLTPDATIEMPDGEPPRKKRAYNKKTKPEQRKETTEMPRNLEESSWPVPEFRGNPDSSRMRPSSPSGGLEREHGATAYAVNPPATMSVHQPYPSQHQSLYPEVPSMYTAPAGHTPYDNSSEIAVNGDTYAAQSPVLNQYHNDIAMESRESVAESEYTASEIDEEDTDEDQDADEGSAVYSNIMSRVNMITGKSSVHRGRDQAKQGLEDFLNFTEAEVEEEEEEEEDLSGDGLEPVARQLGQPSTETHRRVKRVRRRGPRPAAEPTGDVKMRLGMANEAFANSDMVEARRLVDEIIRINAETYEAWNLLSSICQEQADTEGALMALIVAAHLRPKHVEVWLNAVDYALTSMGPLTPRLLREAEFCLASCIRQVPHSIEARVRKAQVLVQSEAWNRAAAEYRYILKRIPRDLQIIRELGEVYVDLKDGTAGLELYRTMLEDFKVHAELYGMSLDWNHANIFAQLWTFVDKKGAQALLEVKSLSRYLLGREHETYWDAVTNNDCEWDVVEERRLVVERYQSDGPSQAAYGQGLPIEIRVSLGKYRLDLGHYEEALRHFGYLLGNDPVTNEAFRYTHPDVLLHVGDVLERAGQVRDAVLFYKALKEVPNENTAELCVSLGKCFLRDDRSKEAEECLREACLLDTANIEARVELARLYERLDEREQAFDYVSQILELESNKRIKLYGAHNLPVPPKEKAKRKSGHSKSKTPATKPRKVAAAVPEREAISEALRETYKVLKDNTKGMRAGNSSAINLWMDAARMLLDDFRSCKAFYPWDRKQFDGYEPADRLRAEQNLRIDIKILSQMHGQNIGNTSGETRPAIPSDVPNHYRGVLFQDWAEMFAEYALCLARRGRGREAYDVCEAAINAICFCFDKQTMYQLHLAYAVCALLSNDEETCVIMARWFMLQYQFSTESYRMFAALMRLCHSPISWYCAGPTQKFILRQIKTMDYAVANEARRKVIHKDKAVYTHLDAQGKSIVNTELDVSLLMIYGHILIAGASYVYALNYFHRALACDPDNPLIALSLGLSYMQYALKRQIDNRQYVITQGVTYMHKYYMVRSKSPHFEERQEAHYNMARAYHLVGLTNLALPLYKKVLKDERKERKVREDGIIGDQGDNSDTIHVAKSRWDALDAICLDAAYNLQIIYTVAGNNELAQKITKKWLVV